MATKAQKTKKANTPFSRQTRVRILTEYFDSVADLNAANAWEHVYHCLLWMNESAGLAHIYDSNHMQQRGGFHVRAARFTDYLCKKWGVNRKSLGKEVDLLFKGCVEALGRQRNEAPDGAIEDFESNLLADIIEILVTSGHSEGEAREVAQKIEALTREYFTIGKKRSNALGEGFEDLLELLLLRVSGVSPARLHIRKPVSKLPGFSKEGFKVNKRSSREPSPDIAITEDSVTRMIATAKWSLRQDRETQFASEYLSFQQRKIQSAELQYALITNEFDLARLSNVCKAIPTGVGAYIFHNVYHISLEMLREVHGSKFQDIDGYVKTGKLLSLSDFLTRVQADFGG